MSNLARRILLIFTVVPFLFAVILFLPHFHYLGISLVITAFIVPGTFEIMETFPGKKKQDRYRHLYILLLFQYLRHFYFLKAGFISDTVLGNYIGILIFIALSYQIFTRDEASFKDINRKTSAAIMIILYPGVFLCSYPAFFNT